MQRSRMNLGLALISFGLCFSGVLQAEPKGKKNQKEVPKRVGGGYLAMSTTKKNKKPSTIIKDVLPSDSIELPPLQGAYSSVASSRPSSAGSMRSLTLSSLPSLQPGSRPTSASSSQRASSMSSQPFPSFIDVSRPSTPRPT